MHRAIDQLSVLTGHLILVLNQSVTALCLMDDSASYKLT